jgi:pimeloyl-ACP methyl ester carboxylesterase
MADIEHLGGHDYRVALPTGRRIGFAQYGDLTGKPVFSFHGGLSCRLDTQFGDALYRRASIRLIAPDRPGIGISDPFPEGGLLDYPADIEHLANALGIERFAAFGWSAGGPYALACAYRIPQRLTHVGLIASVAPLQETGGAIGGLAADRILFPLSRTYPKVASFLLEACRLVPARLLKRATEQQMPPGPDRQLIESLSVHDATAWFYEALRSGGTGMVHEYRMLAEDWGFSVSDIQMKVILWCGQEDALLPEVHSQYLAKTLREADLQLVPRCGHFVFRLCTNEVMQALTTDRSDPGAA